MKTITIEKNIYSFNELSEDAKEKARREYLDIYRDTQWFSEECEYRINELFPNSELDVEYSLSYCQGDGFNIYGKMAIKDAVNYVLEKKSEKIDKNPKFKRLLKWIANNGYILYLPQNGRYGYCCVEHTNYDETILDDLETDGYTSGYEEKEKLLELFDLMFKNCIKGLCKEFEENGYDYFYNTETIDDEINDMLENESFEGFEEDGSIYF